MKYVVILIALIGMAFNGNAAISYIGSTSVSSGSVTTYSVSYTTGSAANEVLVFMAADGGIPVDSSVTWAGNSFTKLSDVAGDNTTVYGVEFWYLINPPRNTLSNLTVTTTGPVISSAILSEYSGVSQVTPFSAPVYSKTGGAGTTISTTITTTTLNSYVFSDVAALGGAGVFSGPAGFTIRNSPQSTIQCQLADKSTPNVATVNSFVSNTGGFAAQFLVETFPFVASTNTTRTMKLKLVQRMRLH